MRLALCAALLLLAGCASGPTAPLPPSDAGSGPSSSATAVPIDPAFLDVYPVVAVAFANTSFEDYTGIGIVDVGVAGAAAEEWDASPALGLPRPVASMVLEIRCGTDDGTGEECPSFWYEFEMEQPDGDVVSWMGSGASQTHRFDAEEIGEGTLLSLRVQGQSDLVAVQSSFDVHYAVALLDTAEAPSGYSAFE